jgi:D-alanyl-D-alanine carboxypeptidase (penicillin-binding protein 5/6)
MRHRPTLLAAFMPVLALASAAHAAAPVPPPPAIDARAYVLVDHQSGRVLAAERADDRVEPASLTKLMTAYVAFRALREKRLALTDEVTISEFAWKAEGSRTFVQVGTRVPVEVLLKGMIVQSGNDATIALAEKIGGTEPGFVQMMNEYARRLGLGNSQFRNSSGLPDPEHYMSARDVALLSQALIREFPEYYAWYSIREYEWNGIRQQNRNGLLGRDPSVDGVKTGHTETAGYCLATSAKRGDMRLVSTVIGSSSMRAREDASAALLNHGFTFYETVKLRGRGETVLRSGVYKGEVDEVALVPARDAFVTIQRGTRETLEQAARAFEPLVAPLAAGKAAGELVVSSGGAPIARIPLVPAKPVAEGGWWSQLVDSVALWWR